MSLASKPFMLAASGAYQRQGLEKLNGSFHHAKRHRTLETFIRLGNADACILSGKQLRLPHYRDEEKDNEQDQIPGSTTGGNWRSLRFIGMCKHGRRGMATSHA